MIAVSLSSLLAIAASGLLPLSPGQYVLAGSPCRDHANAAEFSYDGRAFSYPHASRCLSAVRSHKRSFYVIETTCSGLGDGTPTAPTTVTQSYRTISATRVRVSDAGETTHFDYRWCPRK